MVDAKARAIAEKINKKLGEGTVVLASAIDHSLVPRITSGSLAIDLALGGGWPCNQWVEVIGEESHGKTAVVLKTVAANQARDPNWTVVWVAAETYDPEWAEKLGVDNDRVILVETNNMEAVYDIVIEYCDSRAVDAVVIDSLPALVPNEEDEKAVEAFTVGLGARLTNKFFRKVGPATKRSLITDERPVTGFVINQWRDKIGVMYGDPRTTPNGKGKNFAYFVRAEVRRGSWLKVKDTEVGQEIILKTLKNKSAPPRQSAHVDFYFRDTETDPEFYAGQYDVIKEVCAIAVAAGLVKKSGAWLSYNDEQFHGLANFTEYLRNKPEQIEVIREKVLTLLLPGQTLKASIEKRGLDVGEEA